MKLKNKKTGEIVEFKIHKYAGLSDDGNPIYAPFKSSIEEWEDYEEPKEYWYLENDGDVDSFRWDGDDYDKRMMLIGNCFSSKEEAEKAVEKLKAWKRLKDKGFRFEGWDYEFDIVDKPVQTIILRASAIYTSNTDLDLLFGGEE